MICMMDGDIVLCECLLGSPLVYHTHYIHCAGWFRVPVRYFRAISFLCSQYLETCIWRRGEETHVMRKVVHLQVGLVVPSE